MWKSLTVNYLMHSILKIIRNLNPNKVCGHEMISIRMLKIYDESICKSLRLIFWSCLERESSLQNGKKSLWFLLKKQYARAKDLFFYYLFQSKYLKGCCMTACLSINEN